VAKPLIGSLLRLPREYIVKRMFAELQGAGLDLSESEMAVFMYPGPERRGPIELARQCNMSRQAMNYVLAGLERRSYIERQGEGGARPGR
jgi:DNA-binding MarR family transcriptional regulator